MFASVSAAKETRIPRPLASYLLSWIHRLCWYPEEEMSPFEVSKGCYTLWGFTAAVSQVIPLERAAWNCSSVEPHQQWLPRSCNESEQALAISPSQLLSSDQGRISTTNGLAWCWSGPLYLPAWSWKDMGFFIPCPPLICQRKKRKSILWYTQLSMQLPTSRDGLSYSLYNLFYTGSCVEMSNGDNPALDTSNSICHSCIMSREELFPLPFEGRPQGVQW